MITRTDKLAKQPPPKPLTPSEVERAKRLLAEGFEYVYRRWNQVWAVNREGRQRLLQGKDFAKITETVILAEVGKEVGE